MLWRKHAVSLESVFETLRATGDPLKTSAKSRTVRVGDRVVKTSAGSLLLNFVRHTFQRARYRRAWRSALHLEAHGVACPSPIAHVEWTAAGCIWRHATVSAYLDGCADVERYLDTMIASGGTSVDVSDYFARLARAVNRLVDAGAVHTDLAGKNILTRDGDTFYFIDLDGVLVAEPYTDERRMANHVQLYDSFIDRVDDSFLVPFLRAMLPERVSIDTWLICVKEAQARRRARTESAWAREGKQPPRVERLRL